MSRIYLKTTIRYLTSDIDQFSIITLIELGGCGLHFICKEAFNNININTFDVNNNEICYVPHSIINYRKLEKLDIRSNKDFLLKYIIHCIDKYCNITVIWVNRFDYYTFREVLDYNNFYPFVYTYFTTLIKIKKSEI